MTDPKRMTRRRRPRLVSAGGDADLPESIRAWFAGETPVNDPPPWEALLPPMTRERLRDLWCIYAADHPGAVPPACDYLRAVLCE